MRLRMGILVAVAGVLLLGIFRLVPGPTAGVAGVLTGGEGCPDVPNTYRFTIAYGTVRINGADAPVGTVVEATSPRGNVVGCFAVTTAGHYGAMYIYGEDTSAEPPIPGMREGETVTFLVNGVVATASPVLVWYDDRTPHQVDLTAVPPTAVPPTSVATGTPPPGPTASPSPTETPGKPDLLVEDIAAEPMSPALNEPIMVTVTIRNRGGAAADRFFYTDVYADHVPGGCNDMGWDYARTNGLAAGATAVLTFTHRGFATAGVHAFYVQVDSACQVDESDETNNSFGPLRIQVVGAAAPQADFTASPRTGPAPLTVQFTDLSTGQIDTRLWEFGDGITGTLQNPTHTYNLAGTFTVSLTVTGPGGSDREVKVEYIRVTEGWRVYLPLVLRNR